MKKHQSKRVDIISIKMVKEKSILYKERKITSPINIVELMKDFIEDSDREKFIVIYLNTKNEPIAIHTVSIGSLNASIVHPREVMKGAILSNSSGMILVHNHPSGDTRPSNEDKSITDRLKNAGELLGIKVLDHIIIGYDGAYYSFKENELI
ncbi:DNA repair protein RadC [Tissierella sp. P1]|uniref:JAB domain-containing protein n=1 Tax=Tissierella sp. P1 TaxID=1280483 RepID=UPI000BA0F2F9|nr:DNA repair protein RadC [Tissierella sp. P1]OZV10848.1 DNA repair protein RadC [Tissierella sp. P1]